MIPTVKELANETVTTSTGISTVQGKKWVQQILEYAKQQMFFEQFAYVSTLQKGNKDLALPIATSNKTFTSFSTEASARALTEIDNLNTVTFTPVTKKFGAAVSRDVVRTSQVDVVKFAREQMVYSAALQIDSDIATAIHAATPVQTIYGGDATTTATLATGDTITTNLVAKANRYLKAEGWRPEAAKPFVLFITAAQEEAFLTDSQFVNAAEYGSDTIVHNGEIGKYLGILVISSEQVYGVTDWGSGSLVATECWMVKAKVAYGIVYGEKPLVQAEYKMDEAAYYVYLDVAYHADTLQDKAIVFIRVSDA